MDDSCSKFMKIEFWHRKKIIEAKLKQIALTKTTKEKANNFFFKRALF